MGPCEGDEEGALVIGAIEGAFVGFDVGDEEGALVIGAEEGAFVGLDVGEDDGSSVITWQILPSKDMPEPNEQLEASNQPISFHVGLTD